MFKKILIFIEYIFLLLLGGSIYYGIELLWRGYSHFSMFLVGGICFILIGLINEITEWEVSFWLQLIIGDFIVLVIEFFAGVIVNIWLQLNVWDYSNLPFNLLGQVCLQFAVLWLPIIAFAIVLDDWVKYMLKRGDKPHYNFSLFVK